MEWLHCNRCFVLGGDPSENIQYYIANCGKVVCSRCTDGTTQKCIFHDHDCCYTPLTSMKKEHEALFSNVLQILQKNLKYLDFQMNQFGSLLNYLKSKLPRYNAQKQEIATLKSECRRHRDEKNSLKTELIQKHDEIQELKKQLQRFQQQPHYQSGSQSHYFSSERGSDPPARQNYLFGSLSGNNQLSFSPLANQSSSMFTPPQPVTQPKTYRESNIFHLATPQRKTSPFQSPPTSDYTSTLQRANSRSVLLPGDKASSPLNRISLQRLNLKSAPSFERASQPGPNKTARRTARIGIYGSSKYNSFM